jgi:hypothetical protein
MKTKLLALCSLIALFLVAAVPAFAGSVSLAWDAPTDTEDDEIAGYEVQYGNASGIHTQRLDVGKTLTATVENLAQGQTFFFVVVAYNEGGFSPKSNEVFAKIIGPPGVPQLLHITAKKMAQLDDKLRVKKEHFVAFRNGAPVPNYPERILASRKILDLGMTPKDAVFDR